MLTQYGGAQVALSASSWTIPGRSASHLVREVISSFTGSVHREILLNYPEGTSVAKELIQNADDAGARCISFCLDERSHGVASLLGLEMAPLQGPALLVHNDAVFSEGDFRSISNIGDSIKRAQDGKTGAGTPCQGRGRWGAQGGEGQGVGLGTCGLGFLCCSCS